jgi:hypothetical protein
MGMYHLKIIGNRNMSLVDLAILGDRNVIKKDAEKILKYKDLTTETHCI